MGIKDSESLLLHLLRFLWALRENNYSYDNSYGAQMPCWCESACPDMSWSYWGCGWQWSWTAPCSRFLDSNSSQQQKPSGKDRMRIASIANIATKLTIQQVLFRIGWHLGWHLVALIQTTDIHRCTLRLSSWPSTWSPWSIIATAKSFRKTSICSTAWSLEQGQELANYATIQTKYYA